MVVRESDLVKPQGVVILRDPETGDPLGFIHFNEKHENIIYTAQKASTDEIADLFNLYLKTPCEKNTPQ